MAKSFSRANNESKYVNYFTRFQLLVQSESYQVENIFEVKDIHCIILSFLDLPSLLQCRLVNQNWYQNSINPSSIKHLSFENCYKCLDNTNTSKFILNIKDMNQFRLIDL